LLLLVGDSATESGVFPFIALQLYAGLRPHEAQKMRWEFDHFEKSQIEVKAATSKTRGSRFVPMISPWGKCSSLTEEHQGQ
jgi:integrase